jgi:YafQ family addiction module toxin component
MRYLIRFTPTFENQIRRIKKKDKILFKRVTKKIKDISRQPEHYKPLRNVLKGFRRAHVNPFVLIFDIQGDLVTFHYIKHHDDAY